MWSWKKLKKLDKFWIIFSRCLGVVCSPMHYTSHLALSQFRDNILPLCFYTPFFTCIPPSYIIVHLFLPCFIPILALLPTYPILQFPFYLLCSIFPQYGEINSPTPSSFIIWLLTCICNLYIKVYTLRKV